MNQVAGWKKLVFGAIATVILGAVGSGLWETGLKPGGQWVGRTVLSAVTFGSTVVKDTTYREAAKGLHEAPALQMYSFFASILAGTALGMITALFIPGRSFPKAVERPQNPEQALRAELSELDADLKKLNRRLEAVKILQRRLFPGILILLCIAVGIMLTNYLELLQANEACVYFSQVMAECRPYMDDRQARIVQARFAGMNGRADFIAITEELKRIANANRVTLPKFDPW